VALSGDDLVEVLCDNLGAELVPSETVEDTFVH